MTRNVWPPVLFRWFLLLSVLTVAACGRSYGPAPVVFRDQGIVLSEPGSQYRPPEPIAPEAPEPRSAPELQAWPSSGKAVVQNGDTLYEISRRYGVSVGALVSRNRLTDPYQLVPGQQLLLPRPNVHVVRTGETVFSLARRYGVDMADLVRHNSMKPPFAISVGQRLRVPALDPMTPRVQAAALSPRPVPKYVLPTPGPPAPDSRPSWWRSKTPPPRQGGRFLWPVRGPVLVAFGAHGKGLHNDGINIAAKHGAPVRAAENGLVSYAGNQLRGFGNLVLLKHADGWSSAYAHNSRVLVKPGQRVRRGQIIAKVGSTGSVLRPQLHFELRRGDNAVDPSKHLTVRTARR